MLPCDARHMKLGQRHLAALTNLRSALPAVVALPRSQHVLAVAAPLECLLGGQGQQHIGIEELVD